jgi:hypothetical protein
MPPRRVSNVAEWRSRVQITCDFLKGQAMALQAIAFTLPETPGASFQYSSMSEASFTTSR